MSHRFLLVAAALVTASLADRSVLAEAGVSPPRFALCTASKRVTCVVDGDTFWLNGVKIRMADINAPEVGHPACAYEAELGGKATRRLLELLNAGAITLATEGRPTDRYGRALRVVRRGPQSLGGMLVAEGLAEPWTGHRRNWCGDG